MNHTELALHECVADISNENGVLVDNSTPDATQDAPDSSAANGSGTCDLRSVNNSCTEYTGSASELEAQEETCVSQGGTWSADKCPAPSSDGGCCSWDGHHACGYTRHEYFAQMDPCFGHDVCNCDVGR